MAAAKVAKTKKKKITQSIDKGQVHIKSSFNNTVVTFTDMAVNGRSWSSSGKLGFKGSKKSTPFAAQSSVEDAAKVAKDTEKRVTDNIRANGLRPNENGGSSATATSSFDVTKLTAAQRRDLANRAMQGERIQF